ncbi:MAG: diadenylate cyclase CdaA [bacterium]
MTKVGEWLAAAQRLNGWDAARAALEIAIIGVIVYYLILSLQRTRAALILRGLGVLFVVFVISYILRLETMLFFFQAIGVMILVALPIVFQPELRRALEQLGQRGFLQRSFAGLEKEDVIKLIHSLVVTLDDLALVKMGALIVIEQETPLDEFTASGTLVGGRVTPELLKTIFFPHTFLHDGAVIIRGNRILAAGCFLPHSENPNLSQDVGSRHRAALGVTETTDAISLVVSEETGGISLAHQGKLIRDIKPDALRELLYSICLPQGASFSSLLGPRVEEAGA